MTELPNKKDEIETASPANLISIVIATFNEVDNITATIEAIFRNVAGNVEVIVVDDNSTDGTADAIRALNNPNVKLIVRTRGRGMASAVARGIIASSGDVVCWIDADMARETAAFQGMIDKTADFDVVIASRFVPGGRDDRRAIRVLASHMINGLARLVLGYKIMDFDSCVVAVRRRVFDDVLPIPYGGGDFFIEFIYDCCRRGFKVTEHPYTLYERKGGQSKMAPNLPGFLWLGAKYCMRIFATRFRGN
jgi:dolichol-phosphate mannosyltransferase